jgi:putative transposase
LAPSLNSKSERTKDMKARRREAILRQRGQSGETQFCEVNPSLEYVIPSEDFDDKKQKVISMLKRKKGDKSEM